MFSEDEFLAGYPIDSEDKAREAGCRVMHFHDKEADNLPARREDLLPVRVIDADSDELIEFGRSMGMSYHKGNIDEILGMEVGYVEPLGSMVIIKLGAGIMSTVDVTLDWLMSVLPDEPRQQIIDAGLVIATDPHARLASIIKAEVNAGDMLEMKTAALG